MFISKKRAKLLGLILIPYLYGMKPVRLRASQHKGNGNVAILEASGESTPKPRPAFGQNLSVNANANANAAAYAAPSPSSVSAQIKADEKRRSEPANGGATGRASRFGLSKRPSASAQALSGRIPSILESEHGVFEGARDFSGRGRPLTPSKPPEDIFKSGVNVAQNLNSQLGSQGQPGQANEVGVGEILDINLNAPDYVRAKISLDQIKQSTKKELSNPSAYTISMAKDLQRKPVAFIEASFKASYREYVKQQTQNIHDPKQHKEKTEELIKQSEKIWQEILKESSQASPAVQGRRTPSSVLTLPAAPAAAHAPIAAPAPIPTLDQQSGCSCTVQ